MTENNNIFALMNLHCGDNTRNFIDVYQSSYPESNQAIQLLKTDKLISIFYAFLIACKRGNLELAKWLVKQEHIILGIEPDNPKSIIKICTNDDNIIFDYACRNGHLDICKWLITLNSDIIHGINSHNFSWSCSCGNLDLLKWMVEMNPLIDIKDNDNFGLQLACGHNEKNSLEIVKWLLETFKPTVSEFDFYEACQFDKLDVAQYLFKNYPELNTSEIITKAFYYSWAFCGYETVKWIYSLDNSLIDNYDTFYHICKAKKVRVAEWISSLLPNKYKLEIVDGSIVKFWIEYNSDSDSDSDSNSDSDSEF